MDFHSNLEYLCRVCAANTKGKNSVAECAYILKTPGLKDKLDKFLYLKISENDSLPKVLCKSCFRQVEATASLSKIAKHTQQVFRDFLLSNLPKGPFGTTTNAQENNSSDLKRKPDMENRLKKEERDESTAPTITLTKFPSPAAMLPPQLKPIATTSRKDEVVVNVSVADPLTRDNQQKMISNSQRRQSLLIESRYTPKSIAQKTPATIQKLIAPHATEATNIMNNQNNTAPALNFFSVKTPQQLMKPQMQTTQITTFSSGGYVIGRPTTSNNEEPKKINLPLVTAADNVLQQKRKNLVKALNNIKANNSGQVSLLKSSQQKQATTIQNAIKIPLAEVVNQTVEDELPEKIIIAAPKSKFNEKPKKEPLNLSSKQVIPAIPAIPQMPTTTATITAVVPQSEQLSPFATTPPKPIFAEDILLGRVIRDMDLLKLILKALKWPVTAQNIELQLQRLKNSKFTDIMSDPNLLQDTDLTQLLGPYLAPVLLAAQAMQQQQQQILKNTTLNQNVSTAFKTQTTKPLSAIDAVQAEINKSIPYKLPPETSVQLVPATIEEPDAVKSPPLSALNSSTSSSSSSVTNLKRNYQNDTNNESSPSKKLRRAAIQKARDSIIISDEDENTEEEMVVKSKPHTTKTASNIQIELNSNFMSQFGLLNGSGGDDANAAIMALLQRQKAAIMKNKKVQRRRRNSVSNLITLPPSEFDALIDLDDDIVLMEPGNTTNSSDCTPALNTQETVQQKNDATNPFVIPTVPLITRPIIKRRKTVIHSSKGRYDLSIELKDKEQTPLVLSPNSSKKEQQFKEIVPQTQFNANNLATQACSSTDTLIQQNQTKVANTEVLMKTSLTDTQSSKTTPQKKLQNKAALGQQLLEAIGLQQISPNIVNTPPQTETATSSTLTNPITTLPNSKQSVQQIRSALKKSLKQAQEQQQQRKKESSSSATNAIQDANSTPKSLLKEIVVVEGKGNKSDSCSSLVDVEEQIDKVTLMVRSNDNDKGELESSSATIATEKEDKKEFKKSAATKTQDKRRTIPAIAAARSGAGRSNDTTDSVEESNKDEENREDEKNAKTKADNEKIMDKEETENPNSETNPTKDEAVTPRRRGRKRISEKQNEMETAVGSEKDKDIKPIAAVVERSKTVEKNKDEDLTTTSDKKEEEDTTDNKTSSRPTRQSKTLSKYYKGPDKPAQSRRSLPSRSTRNR